MVNFNWPEFTIRTSLQELQASDILLSLTVVISSLNQRELHDTSRFTPDGAAIRSCEALDSNVVGRLWKLEAVLGTIRASGLPLILTAK